MNLKDKLSQRIGVADVQEITRYVQGDDERKQALYDLLYDTDDTVAYQAAWVFTHFSRQESEWLYDKQDKLTDKVLVCKHPGIRRLLLNILYQLPLSNPPRIDLLEFCLQHSISKDELPGVQTLCLKLAYEICLLIPELLEEFRLHLDLVSDSPMPSIYSVHKNLLKAMRKRKSLVC